MKKITFGGWYQRTTLHLTEVYRFLKIADSKLGLDKNKLKIYKRELDLKEIKRVQGYLEYIEA